MLELKDLHKTFNPGTVNAKTALNGLSLTLRDGEFVTVIGGNGAGKSTMLNATAGTLQVDSGEVFLDGIDVTDLPEYKRASYIGRVFQDPMMGTAPSMHIEENLALAARRGQKRGLRWGISKEERETYRTLLSDLGLGLETRLSSEVSTLSGGQRQALTLLMATLKSPKLLLLDEHTGSDRHKGEADHADDHPQHAGRHSIRQPPYHAPRGPGDPGYFRRGEETADRD